MWSLLKCCLVSSIKWCFHLNSPLRTLFHEEVSVSSIRVTPGVHDGAAGGEIDIPLSLPGVPQSPPCEIMMDLQLARVLVVGQLAADPAVWTTGGVLATLGLLIA